MAPYEVGRKVILTSVLATGARDPKVRAANLAKVLQVGVEMTLAELLLGKEERAISTFGEEAGATGTRVRRNGAVESEAPSATTASTNPGSTQGVTYTVDESTGLTVRAEGVVSGPHRGRGKGYRPEPVGGRLPGDHRGHLIPEGGVDNPASVNVRQNIIAESPRSNLGPKKQLDLLASRMAAQNPNSTVRVVAEVQRRPGESRPFAVTYWIERDGQRVYGQTILNPKPDAAGSGQ